MTNYLRLTTGVNCSEQSDNSKPFQKLSYAWTNLPTEFSRWQVTAATGGGTTLELGTFTTVTAAIIANTDATNFVVVTTGYGAATPAIYLPLGAHTILYNLTPSDDILIVADTAACICDVWVWGT